MLLTRDDDRRVPIDDRTAMANNNKSDLFISLHANASFRPALAGGSIYSAAFEPGAAQAARALAPERVPAIGGGSRDIEFVPWEFAQTAHLEESDALAKLLEAQLHDRVPLAARPVDSAPLRVLESANMPAILIEIGYLTNPDQERQLASAEFQNPFVQARARRHRPVPRRARREAPGGGERSGQVTARRVLGFGALAVAVARDGLGAVRRPAARVRARVRRRFPRPRRPPRRPDAGSRRASSTSPKTARG